MGEMGDRYPLPSLPYLYLVRQHPPSERDDVPRPEAHPEPKVFDADVTSLKVSERRKYRVRLFGILFIDVVPGAAIE